MEEIRKLLDTADQKLARDDLDGAEHDYRRALDLAEKKRQKELIDRAYKGCTTVQQRRIVPAMNGGADKAIAELKLQYAKASGEERKLLLLKQLLNAGVDKIDDRPSTELYGELLNELRRRCCANHATQPSRAIKSSPRCRAPLPKRSAPERWSVTIKRSRLCRGQASGRAASAPPTRHPCNRCRPI